MDRSRYLAAGLLCLTGVIHAARLGIPQSDGTFGTIAVIFGVAYLIIGACLFWNRRTAYYFGAIVPLIGICVGIFCNIVGILTKPTIWMTFLLTIDVVIALCCFYLIRRKRSTAQGEDAVKTAQ